MLHVGMDIFTDHIKFYIDNTAGFIIVKDGMVKSIRDNSNREGIPHWINNCQAYTIYTN